MSVGRGKFDDLVVNSLRADKSTDAATQAFVGCTAPIYGSGSNIQVGKKQATVRAQDICQRFENDQDTAAIEAAGQQHLRKAKVPNFAMFTVLASPPHTPPTAGVPSPQLSDYSNLNIAPWQPPHLSAPAGSFYPLMGLVEWRSDQDSYLQDTDMARLATPPLLDEAGNPTPGRDYYVNKMVEIYKSGLYRISARIVYAGHPMYISPGTTDMQRLLPHIGLYKVAWHASSQPASAMPKMVPISTLAQTIMEGHDMFFNGEANLPAVHVELSSGDSIAIGGCSQELVRPFGNNQNHPSVQGDGFSKQDETVISAIGGYKYAVGGGIFDTSNGKPDNATKQSYWYTTVTGATNNRLEPTNALGWQSWQPEGEFLSHLTLERIAAGPGTEVAF